MAEGHRWQRALRRRWWFLPDLDAEIRAAVWEQYLAGVTDQRRLFAAACVAVRRVQRCELRWRQARLSMDVERPVVVDVDGLASRIDAARVVRGLPVPVQAAPWVQMMSHGDNPGLPRLDMDEGRWWANVVRDHLVDRGVSRAA